MENNQGDHHMLPIIISKRSEKYMSEESKANSPYNFWVKHCTKPFFHFSQQKSKAQYLDNARLLFRLNLRLVSTIYPEDIYLNNFFKLYRCPHPNDRDLLKVFPQIPLTFSSGVDSGEFRQ